MLGDLILESLTPSVNPPPLKVSDLLVISCLFAVIFVTNEIVENECQMNVKFSSTKRAVMMFSSNKEYG